MRTPQLEEYTEEQIKEYLDSLEPREGFFLINQILDLLKNNRNICTPLHRPLQTFLINAFEQILSGSDANKAFLLQRGKGRPKVNGWRDIFIGMEVHQRMDRGMSYDEAIETVSTELQNDSCDFESKDLYAIVKRAYDSFAREIRKK